MIFLIIALLLSIIIFTWQASNVISMIFGVPYVKTNNEIIKQTLELVRLKKGEMLYDIGSGNGDVLIEAAKKGANATGIEISPFNYMLSKLRTRRYSNVKIRFQNIKNSDLSNADVIYCYLIPEMLKTLALKLKKEHKIGRRVVSIGFPISLLELKMKKYIRGHFVYFY